MTRKSVRIVTAFSVILPLLPGCALTPVPPEAATPVSQRLVKATRSWDGRLLPAYPQGQPEITILHITIPAGSRLATHFHPVINAGVLLSGQLTVVATDGKTLHLEAGDPIIELVNTPHYGMNHGKVPAEIIVFYAGVPDTPITVVEPP